MKKNIKVLTVGLLTIFVVGSFISCNSSDKALEKGKELINERQYEKAVVSLELALDDNPKNKEAKELKDMIESYLEANKALENGNIRKAEVKAQAIGDKDKEFPSFKQCVDTLEKTIDEKAEYDKEVKNDMEKLETYLENKNYSEALLLAKSLDGRVMTKDQKDMFDKIKLKITSDLSIESTEK